MSHKKYIIFLAIIFWLPVLYGQTYLEVNFFDIGQGDSIFIETPEGKQILIDGGPSNLVLEKLSQEMSFWDRKIDLVILTHPDADHLTGLVAVLKRFDVGQILIGGGRGNDATYAEWQRVISEKNILVQPAAAGQKIILGSEIEMEILWPEQPLTEKGTNDNSVVARLVYNQAEFLLTGDITSKVEDKLKGDLESDVLKVAHHGSRYSSDSGFIQKVNPKISVISVGENNFGHPHPDTLERLRETLIYRTDLSGDIKMKTDGLELKIN